MTRLKLENRKEIKEKKHQFPKRLTQAQKNELTKILQPWFINRYAVSLHGHCPPSEIRKIDIIEEEAKEAFRNLLEKIDINMFDPIAKKEKAGSSKEKTLDFYIKCYLDNRLNWLTMEQNTRSSLPLDPEWMTKALDLKKKKQELIAKINKL